MLSANKRHKRKGHVINTSCCLSRRCFENDKFSSKINIWAVSSQKVSSNMCKMCRFRLPLACAKYHPSLCSPFIHSLVNKDSVSGQGRPWSACANMQADLGLRCLYMPEDMFSHGAAQLIHNIGKVPGPMSYLYGLALRIWTSFWRREDFDGMDMWNAPVVQSRQSLTYRLMGSMGW